MINYYVNTVAQSNGDHEVHREGCGYFPTVNGKYLGIFNGCASAVSESQRFYSQSNGCFYCSKECHTS